VNECNVSDSGILVPFDWDVSLSWPEAVERFDAAAPVVVTLTFGSFRWPAMSWIQRRTNYNERVDVSQHSSNTVSDDVIAATTYSKEYAFTNFQGNISPDNRRNRRWDEDLLRKQAMQPYNMWILLLFVADYIEAKSSTQQAFVGHWPNCSLLTHHTLDACVC
jgi:hypothetical protein